MMNFRDELEVTENKSVDSLLMHNYSPPNHQTSPLLHIPQPQLFPQHQQHPTYQFVVKQQYRKVRPEPVNERSLVGSVVGYLHERVVASVVGEKASGEANRLASNGGLVSGAGSNGIPSMHEIKEQIEWLHFENISQLDVSRCQNATSQLGGSSRPTSPFNDSNVLLLVGYKTGFSVWIIDTNGVASECLLIKEPNITHVKVIQIEGSGRILLAICKLVLNDSPPASVLAAQQQSHNNYHLDSTYNENSNDSSGASDDNLSPGGGSLNSSDPALSPCSSVVSSPNTTAPMSPLPGPPPVPIVNSATSSTQYPKRYAISIVNVATGECLRQINYTGHIIELKSNGSILCVNSWMRIDAYDLTTYEHRFTLNTCYSQLSKSSGKLINPIALGSRWLAFADTKYHGMLASIGGVSTGLEPSYTATVLNTAKSISKGLVTVVQSVMTGGSSTNENGSGQETADMKRKRHDSKDEHQLHYQPGVCTIIDTKKYFNTHFKQNQLHDEAQNWIIAHFNAHQEALYALEFNQNGRLLVTCDSLGQYFNVFQINPNPFKCTRSSVKHLYSLYRGDTVAKVRNIAFSADNRWLAVNSKRGTTHIFPINPHGGPINVRTHSRPFVANRTSKHQRTAGFSDQDGDLFLNLTTTTSAMSMGGGAGGMDEAGSSHSSSSPIVLQNNPKLRSLLEPFVIPAYAQLKQPNVNSQFQSSVLSTNGISSLTGSSSNNSNGPMGLLATVSALQPQQYMQQQLSSNGETFNGSLLSGSNLAASAYNSAALVTENVSQFGMKNFSMLASNTSNLIQYDNVTTVSVFADSRGYLSPEEPRDLNRLRPAQSLFVISDVNGNLVEYVLDVVIDTNKSASGKLSQDCPIQLKITPKAQWPLQRFISSAEVKIPIYVDNPLVVQGFSPSTTASVPRKPSLNSYDSYSPNSLFVTAPNSIEHMSGNNGVPSDWMKSIEVNTHIGPHRRLFMGPQFVFKTFNSSIQTNVLNAGSSAVIGDSETPIIDLSDEIELNTLDITNGSKQRQKYSMPMQINHNVLASKSYTSMKQQHQPFGCTPTFIEVGPGSYQEGMPIMSGALANQHRNGSQKSLNNGDLLGDNLIESLADAMNELNTSEGGNYSSHLRHPRSKHNSSSSGHSSAKTMSPAIAIHHNLQHQKQSTTNNGATTISSNKATPNNMLLINTMPVEQASSLGSNSSSNGILTVGSYFLVNGMASGMNSNPSSSLSSGPPSSASSTGSSNAPNSSGSNNNNSSNELDLVVDPTTTFKRDSFNRNLLQFQDENLLN